MTRWASRGDADPLRPQRPSGLRRGALLALVIHGGLVVALAVGVSWRSREPTGATAELWAAVPEFAAPAPVVPPPPTPAPPTPAPTPAPPPPAPEPKVDPQAAREAEIAIEKAKRERELEIEREREREKERKAKAEVEKKRLLAEQEAQRKKEEAEAAQRKKLAAEKAEKAELARLEKLREDNLKRIQGQAGATGGPTATGTAQRDAGPSAGYAGRIIARVKPNIVFTDAIVGKPTASVEVRTAPDGTIIGRRIVKASGNREWDEAVLRALDRTEILPRDTDGRVPSPMTIDFTP